MDQLIRITSDVIFAAAVLGSRWGDEYQPDGGNAKVAPLGSQIESRVSRMADEAHRETSETGVAQMSMF